MHLNGVKLILVIKLELPTPLPRTALKFSVKDEMNYPCYLLIGK